MNSLYKEQFFGHWRWVHIRTCKNGHETRILGNDTRRIPTLPPGAIKCSQCDEVVSFVSDPIVAMER